MAQVRWWDVAFAVLLPLTALVTVPGNTAAGGAICLIVLVAWAVLYVTHGRRHLTDPSPAALLYAVPAVLGFATLLPLGTGEAWLLAFILFPQIWAMLPVRAAVALDISACVTVAGALWWVAGRDAQSLAAGALFAIVAIAASVSMGLLIDRLVHEAHQRAEIIDELHRTRAELADLTRSEGVFAERERLSREIHDTVAQTFTSVLALSRAARSAIRRGDLEAAQERLALLEQSAADGLGETRASW